MPRLLVQIVGFVFTMLAVAPAAAQLAAQRSSEGGVTVAVTPRSVGSGANTWDFAIVLDTHSQDLSDDLLKSAVLVDNRGNEFKALGWEGAAPGGHHREGVLKFKAIAPRPEAIELRIDRPGEAKARVFQWELKTGASATRE